MRKMWTALAAAAVLLVALADIPEGVDTWQPLTSAAAVIATAAVFTRRRSRPFGVLAALLALGVVALSAQAAGEAGQIPFGLIVVIGIGLADVARWSSRRTGAVVGILAVAIAVLVELAAEGRGWTDVAFDVSVWGLAGAAGLAVRFWRQAGEARAERTRIAERERIARELHDVVAHHVSAIAMTAEGARAVVGVDPAQADRSLAAIHQAATTTLDEMRRMVAILRDDDGAGSEVPQALDELVDAFAHIDRPRVVVSVEQVEVEPPAAVRAAVFRIAQEAVTNAVRHAPTAERVEVFVAGGADELAVTVSNDGRPAPARPGERGFGIEGMRERAELLGGTFRAGPAPGGGWQVMAALPFDRAVKSRR